MIVTRIRERARAVSFASMSFAAVLALCSRLILDYAERRFFPKEACLISILRMCAPDLKNLLAPIFEPIYLEVHILLDFQSFPAEHDDTTTIAQFHTDYKRRMYRVRRTMNRPLPWVDELPG